MGDVSRRGPLTIVCWCIDINNCVVRWCGNTCVLEWSFGRAPDGTSNCAAPLLTECASALLKLALNVREDICARMGAVSVLSVLSVLNVLSVLSVVFCGC